MAKQKLISARTSTSSIPYPTTEERTCRDGNVVLFLRKHSAQWQARIRRFSGKWFDVSTNTSDFERAKQVAGNKYDAMLRSQQTGDVDINRQFKDVARLTIRELHSELDKGIGKVVYESYILAINKYLIPCLGSLAIHNINHAHLARLDVFRTEKLGRTPNKSTVTTHNAALNRIFKTAIAHGFMLPTQIPQLHNKGLKPQARPYFDEREFAALTEHLEIFAGIGRKRETRDTRQLLRDYVLILAHTGMRTGREALSLKWCSIRRLTLPEGSSGLELSIQGKTGKRTLIAKDADGVVSESLGRIQKRDPQLAALLLDELFRIDAYVFRTSSGQRVKHGRLAKHFKKLLEQYDLLKNAQGEERTLYSLRHMYATFQILNGVDMATLAVQMGTSIGMLEKHYSKLKPYMKLAALNGTNPTSHIAPSTELSRVETLLSALHEAIISQNALIFRLIENSSGQLNE